MTEHRLTYADVQSRKVTLKCLETLREGTGHSIFSPSASHMYLVCPGSLIPNLLAIDAAGEDAAYGTVAHHVTELWLKTRSRPSHLIGTNQFIDSGNWGYLIWIDEEMLEHAKTCVDYVEYLPGKHYAERRVDISDITPIPNQSGTSDYTIIDGDVASVWDWKFGKRKVVYAKWNTQLLLYAFGVMRAADAEGIYIRTFKLHIAQPRIDHYDEWEISRDDLLIWAGWAKARMQEAWRIDAPRRPGAEQCMYCKVRPSCAAAAKLQFDVPRGVFSNLDADFDEEQMIEFKGDLELDNLTSFATVAELSTREMAQIRLLRPLVDPWWKALDKELLLRGSRGEDISPLKVVEARSRRGWANEKRAQSSIELAGVPRDEIVREVTSSPAEAEKQLRKVGIKGKELEAFMAPLVSRRPGKPTIAPLYDKRPALVDMSEIAFSDLDDDEVTEDGDM